MTLVSDAPGAAPAGRGDFERTPPQAIEAEQSVLGAMMLSKDAIADVVEVIKPGDFYRPAHQMIYDAVLDLYARGEPADAVTVSAELTRSGQLSRVGGATYLHTLISMVPTAANAGYYAAIVAERATLRRLVTAGTRIVQMGYDASSGANDVVGSVDDVVDRAQAEIYDVTERRTSEDYVHIETLLHPTLDEIEKISATGGIGTGIPTGFHQLDEITNGLHPGQMITVAGRPGSGKALALDTPLPTPSGWTTMGRVAVGDQLLGANGLPTRVVAATGVMAGRPCFDVEFSDGSVITADAEHQWLVHQGPDDGVGAPGQPARQAPTPAMVGLAGFRHPSRGRGLTDPRTQFALRSGRITATVGEPVSRVLTTAELASALGAGSASAPGAASASAAPGGLAVACTAPLVLPPAPLPVPPYMLGACLGNGAYSASALIGDDVPLVEQLRAQGAHIPQQYLRAGEGQRRALLRGLLDTHGYARGGGAVELAVDTERLAHDVRELVVSLGYVAQLLEPGAPGAGGEQSSPRTSYTICFTTADRVFGLRREADRDIIAVEPGATTRDIVAVRPVESVPVRCVEVDNTDHLFLAGPSMIPTHNSTLALDVARSAAVKHRKTTAIFSLEMGKLEIMMRLFSAEAGVALQNMRSGHMSDQDWRRLALRSSELAEAPLFIDDSPNLTMMEIRAKARRLSQRHDLALVVIDYLQLMTSGKRVESRQQEVSEFSRAMKLLAKELDVPVVALSQLNRGPEQRTDKRPLLSDLRESGCLPASARVWRADTGEQVSIGELFASGARDIAVWALDEQMRMVRRRMSRVFCTGVRPVLRLTLRSGRRVHATGNHPLFTYDGWRPLGELTVGTEVAVPRRVEGPTRQVSWEQAQVTLLGQLLGGGAFAAGASVRYACTGTVNAAVVTAAASQLGARVVCDSPPGAPVTALRLTADPCGGEDPVAGWLAHLGLTGVPRQHMFVPADVNCLTDDQLSEFLGQLWACAGRIEVGPPAAATPDPPVTPCTPGTADTPGTSDTPAEVLVAFTTPSRRLADDVLRLLARWGVLARIDARSDGGIKAGSADAAGLLPSHSVRIDEPRDQAEFVRRIAGTPQLQAAAAAALAVLGVRADGDPSADTDADRQSGAAPDAAGAPVTADGRCAVWARVDALLSQPDLLAQPDLLSEPNAAVRRNRTAPGPVAPHRALATLAEASRAEPTAASSAAGTSRLSRVVAVLDAADFDLVATNDVYWDEVVGIEQLGEQQVFDATVPGEHNFVADGVVVHNSIEQDSDVVLLVHRPDLYEPETERAGEADLIIAKHRNGPTATVAVAFQGRYSRFADMPS